MVAKNEGITVKNKRVLIKNSDDNLKDFTKKCCRLAFIGIIFIVISALILNFIKGIIFDNFDNEWNKLKNDCELYSILSEDKYQYICKDNLIVTNDKIDSNHWKNFKIKNNCYLKKYDLTLSKNKKQWQCDNSIIFYYDDNKEGR